MTRKSIGNHAIDGAIYIFLTVLTLVTLYPFLNSLAVALNDSMDTTRGGITIYPRIITLDNFQVILSNPMLYKAYYVTIFRTVVGTVTSVLITAMVAYGMSKPYLKGRKIYMTLSIITMYFGGGLIPYYLLIKTLHMTNNLLVYIIPNLFSVFNMILMMTHFKGLPAAIEESAEIDGAGKFTIFFRIIFPVSTPILATIALFNGVFQWNSWFDAALYMTNQDLKPVQSILVSIIDSTRFMEALKSAGAAARVLVKMKNINTRSITMATVVTAVVPILMVYPFLQRYFVKGIMIGSIKG